ncbi:MAG: DUF177 domain-containing protein [Bacteroidota bacterium]
MKELNKYDIDILKLSDKQHVYTFESGDSFFESFEQSLLKKGNVLTRLLLDKGATMLRLSFHITGWIELICDRTLEPFEHSLEITQQLILKFGDENKELTDEIEMIVRDTPRINIAQYIFEFISLSLPMKKLHPKLSNQPIAQETEEGVLIYSSEKTDDKSQEEEEPAIDPRWQALQKLKNEGI